MKLEKKEINNGSDILNYIYDNINDYRNLVDNTDSVFEIILRINRIYPNWNWEFTPLKI